MRLSDFLGTLLGSTGISQPGITRNVNYLQAQRLGDEWIDEVLDLIHDDVKASPATPVSTKPIEAGVELRELAAGLEGFYHLELAAKADPPASKEKIKAARRALREQTRNVSRALVGAPLTDFPPQQ